MNALFVAFGIDLLSAGHLGARPARHPRRLACVVARAAARDAATRLALGVAVGLLTFGSGSASHGLHVVNLGPDTFDVTGVGMIVGGL